MGVANLVSGFWNSLYLKIEQIELTDSLLAGTNSRKFKDD